MIDIFTGYYTYKNIATINKYEIMINADTLEDVKYHFHDDFFSSFDWTKEPKESIEYYYAERAKQIRDDYDYVILMYSGGSDSHNVLETFINNNIFLDEICSSISYKGSGLIIGDALNHEILGVGGAKEKAERIKHENTIYRLYDITDYTLNRWNNTNDCSLWSINSRPPGGRILDLGVDRWTQLHESGKKICFVWANQKPIIKIYEDNYYFTFSDNLNTNRPFRESLIRDNAVDEQFYHWPNIQSANIIIKQCHMIKNLLEKIGSRIFLIKKYGKVDEDTVRNLELWSGEVYRIGSTPSSKLRFGGNEMKELIYPRWKKSDYIPIAKETTSVFLNKQEQWFWNSNSEAAKKYLDIIHGYSNEVKDIWKNGNISLDNNEFIKFMKVLQTKRYYLQ